MNSLWSWLENHYQLNCLISWKILPLNRNYSPSIILGIFLVDKQSCFLNDSIIINYLGICCYSCFNPSDLVNSCGSNWVLSRFNNLLNNWSVINNSHLFSDLINSNCYNFFTLLCLSGDFIESTQLAWFDFYLFNFSDFRESWFSFNNLNNILNLLVIIDLLRTYLNTNNWFSSLKNLLFRNTDEITHLNFWFIIIG